MFKRIFLFLNLVFIVIGLTSCNQNNLTKRKYREVVVEPERSSPAMPADHPHLNLPPGHPPIGDMKNANAQASNSSGSTMTTDPHTQAQIEASGVAIPLIWKTPAEWQEVKGSGLRLVTFQSDKDFPVECSIVSLGGMAGGLESNIQRWMGQINLSVSDSEFKQFMQTQEKITSQGNLSVLLIDFTKLQNQSSPDAASMAAGILTVEEKTVFVKMIGSKTAVLHHKDNFRQLCQSLKINEK